MPRPDLFDLLVIIGLALVSTGFGLWWVPAGLIVGGVGLLTIGVLGSRASGRR